MFTEKQDVSLKEAGRQGVRCGPTSQRWGRWPVRHEFSPLPNVKACTPFTPLEFLRSNRHQKTLRFSKCQLPSGVPKLLDSAQTF